MGTRSAVIIAVAAVLLGCDAGSSGCTRLLSPGAGDGGAIQDALAAARPGDVVCFGPGVYALEESIGHAGAQELTIRGVGASRDDVVIDLSGSAGAQGLSFTAARGLRIERLTLRDPRFIGLMVTDSEDVVIDDVRVESAAAAAYIGVYVVGVTGARIESCEVVGSETGIDLDRARDSLVRGNVVRGSFVGTEIGNSTHVEVDANELSGNAIGLLIDELPGVPAGGGGVLVHHNLVLDSHDAFPRTSGEEQWVPPGIGVLVVAARQVEIRDNTITGNDSVGIAVTSYGSWGWTWSDPDYDGLARDVWLHDDELADNGSAPEGVLALIPLQATPPQTFLEDVLYDGAEGSSLCVQEPGAGFRRTSLVEDRPTPSTDVEPYACTGTVVPPVLLP